MFFNQQLTIAQAAVRYHFQGKSIELRLHEGHVYGQITGKVPNTRQVSNLQLLYLESSARPLSLNLGQKKY